MLVSALNSHPEISCEHRDEDVAVSEGRIRGRAMKFLQTNQNKKKVIYLTRNKPDRLKSLKVMGLSEANTEGKEQAQRDSLRDYIEISYEELTSNQNITEIPEKLSYKICDYLEVERKILMTRQVKLNGSTKIRNNSNGLSESTRN